MVPDIGDQVLCVFANNDTNFSTGWILGSYFTEKQPPQVVNPDIMRLDFADGTFFEYNRANSSLTIKVKGTIKINGAEVHIND